ILGAYARLDRAAVRRRRLRGERLAATDPDLQLDQIGPGELLGEPVLDLQARVHLEERGLAVADQELDRAHADVADALYEPHRGVHQLALDGGIEARRRRLLDDLLVAALHRAVAAAERPRGAVRVRDDLRFDVSPA